MLLVTGLAVPLAPDQRLGEGARRRHQSSSGKQWNQQLGPSLALFDAAAAALKATPNPKDKVALARTLASLEVDTPIGHLAWGKGPVGNVVATRSSVASGSPRPPAAVQARVRDLRELGGPQGPDRGQARGVRRLSDHGWPMTAPTAPTAAAPPLLEGRAIVKRYGELVVLGGVDFQVGAGDAVGVVGPNGAGKTTLLSVLAGSVAPAAGIVRFRGEDVTRLPQHARCRRGIGRARTARDLGPRAYAVDRAAGAGGYADEDILEDACGRRARLWARPIPAPAAGVLR